MFRYCFSARKPSTPSASQGSSADRQAESAPVKHIEHRSLNVQVEFDIDVNKVIAIAEDAGQAVRRIYDEPADTADLQVEKKQDESPITRADRESNQIICERLSRLTPHVPIISEENNMPPYEVRKNYKYCWCVDPLDGTKEFLARNGQFTVNIALIHKGQSVLGVVHTPVMGLTHWALKGQGAFVRTKGSDHRIQAASFNPSDSGLVIVCSSSHMSRETKEFVEQFHDYKAHQIGSSLKLLMVAEGLAHVYPRLSPTSEWDTAAAHVIVTEAGGEVLQAGKCTPNGEPLEDWRVAVAKEEEVVYNKEDCLNPFFVVYGKRQKPVVANGVDLEPAANANARAPQATENVNPSTPQATANGNAAKQQ